MHQLTLTFLMHVKFEGVLDLSFVRVSQKEHFNNAHIHPITRDFLLPIRDVFDTSNSIKTDSQSSTFNDNWEEVLPVG